jgi:hypothetical protein
VTYNEEGGAAPNDVSDTTWDLRLRDRGQLMGTNKDCSFEIMGSIEFKDESLGLGGGCSVSL